MQGAAIRLDHSVDVGAGLLDGLLERPEAGEYRMPDQHSPEQPNTLPS
jgi:hypothetical protein